MAAQGTSKGTGVFISPVHLTAPTADGNCGHSGSDAPAWHKLEQKREHQPRSRRNSACSAYSWTTGPAHTHGCCIPCHEESCRAGLTSVHPPPPPPPPPPRHYDSHPSQYCNNSISTVHGRMPNQRLSLDALQPLYASSSATATAPVVRSSIDLPPSYWQRTSMADVPLSAAPTVPQRSLDLSSAYPQQLQRHSIDVMPAVLAHSERSSMDATVYTSQRSSLDVAALDPCPNPPGLFWCDASQLNRASNDNQQSYNSSNSMLMSASPLPHHPQQQQQQQQHLAACIPSPTPSVDYYTVDDFTAQQLRANSSPAAAQTVPLYPRPRQQQQQQRRSSCSIGMRSPTQWQQQQHLVTSAFIDDQHLAPASMATHSLSCPLPLQQQPCQVLSVDDEIDAAMQALLLEANQLNGLAAVDNLSSISTPPALQQQLCSTLHASMSEPAASTGCFNLSVSMPGSVVVQGGISNGFSDSMSYPLHTVATGVPAATGGSLLCSEPLPQQLPVAGTSSAVDYAAGSHPQTKLQQLLAIKQKIEQELLQLLPLA